MTKKEISFNDWQNLDLRVGKIIKVEDVKNADRLYKLTINLGKEIGKRTLVAGLKSHYTSKELKNKPCIVFTNLEPKTIRGVESKGMVLASINEEKNQVQLLQPDKDIKVGSKIC